MFTTPHFIWLGIVILLIAGLLIFQKKYDWSFTCVMNIMLTISIMSEVTKILCNMMPAPDGRTGMILDPGDLPFHLCSIQIFLLFGLKFLIKSPSTKENLLGFMAPTMLIGAVLAFLVPTVGVEFTVVQVYQYFIFHTFLVFFSVYIIKNRLVNWTKKRYMQNISYLAMFALLAMWINSSLSGVLPRVNFMYLVRPPMKDLPFLTLEHGWYVYFLHLVSLGLIIIPLFHLPFIIAERKKKQ